MEEQILTKEMLLQNMKWIAPSMFMSFDPIHLDFDVFNSW